MLVLHGVVFVVFLSLLVPCLSKVRESSSSIFVYFIPPTGSCNECSNLVLQLQSLTQGTQTIRVCIVLLYKVCLSLVLLAFLTTYIYLYVNPSLWKKGIEKTESRLRLGLALDVHHLGLLGIGSHPQICCYKFDHLRNILTWAR